MSRRLARARWGPLSPSKMIPRSITASRASAPSVRAAAKLNLILVPVHLRLGPAPSARVVQLEATGYKLQVTGYKLQVTSYRLHVTSYKLQATSYKPQATSHKLQATSYKLQPDVAEIAPRFCRAHLGCLRRRRLRRCWGRGGVGLRNLQLTSYKLQVTTYNLLTRL